MAGSFAPGFGLGIAGSFHLVILPSKILAMVVGRPGSGCPRRRGCSRRRSGRRPSAGRCPARRRRSSRPGSSLLLQRGVGAREVRPGPGELGAAAPEPTGVVVDRRARAGALIASIQAVYGVLLGAGAGRARLAAAQSMPAALPPEVDPATTAGVAFVGRAAGARASAPARGGDEAGPLELHVRSLRNVVAIVRWLQSDGRERRCAVAGGGERRLNVIASTVEPPATPGVSQR